ncbi:MAG: hypothetical protein RL711_653 [Bacteroidota bacterium]
MKQLIAVTLLFFSLQASAQAPSTVSRDYIPNIVSWNKLALSGKLSQKLNYQIDFEYRRQADPAHSSEPSTTVGNSKSNLFKNPFQYASRVWLHYQADKSFTFSISPIAWFGTWTAPVNNIATFQPEYRSSLQITNTQNFGILALQHRYRYDLRFMGLKSNDETDLLLGPAASYHFEKATIQSRFRYMLRAVMPINNTKIETGTYYTYSHAEIFIKTGESIKNINLLDQFRSAIGFGYKFENDIRIELGYMNIIAYKFNNKALNNIDLLHTVCLSILFDDFQGLFKNNAIATQ